MVIEGFDVVFIIFVVEAVVMAIEVFNIVVVVEVIIIFVVAVVMVIDIVNVIVLFVVLFVVVVVVVERVVAEMHRALPLAHIVLETNSDQSYFTKYFHSKMSIIFVLGKNLDLDKQYD